VLTLSIQLKLQKENIRAGLKRGLILGGLVGGISVATHPDISEGIKTGLIRAGLITGISTGGAYIGNELSKSKIKELNTRKDALKEYHNELKKHYNKDFDLAKARAKLKFFRHVLSSKDDTYPRFQK